MTGIIIFGETEFTISTIGYCEYLSMITSSCSPVGSGPQKYMNSFSKGPSGCLDMFSGPIGGGPAYVDWQAKQFLTAFWTLSFSPGNQSLDRIRDLVLFMP